MILNSRDQQGKLWFPTIVPKLQISYLKKLTREHNYLSFGRLFVSDCI